MFRLWTVFFSMLVAAFFAVGCAQTQLTPEYLASLSSQARTAALLQQPAVDDIYAAKLSHFSQYSFGSGGDAYGLLRVIEVTSDTIVVITEDAAWPEPQGAHDDLNGDFSDISWDPEEEITIQRTTLESLQNGQLILEARRLSSEQIQSYLN